MYIEKVLSNGIRVAAERIPYVKSVSVGVWVGNGSRYETAEENGMSHFIEHMVFKGSSKRSARDIALTIDSIGGQINAFTTRETTCFYTDTLNEYVETALDVLSDMVFSAKISEDDMALERRVIGEEIAMYEDSPEDIVYDLFSRTVWGDTPMGRTILGTEDVLAEITPQQMREYIRTHYTSKNIVIAVSGSFEDSLFDLLEEYFGRIDLLSDKVGFENVRYTPANACLTKDFEQVQLIAGFNSIDIYDESVYALLVFNNVFGSGMSSRLFQNIREKHGLVYSVGAGHSAYMGTGTFDVSAATSPENVSIVSELISKEIGKIKREMLTDEEIERAKVQLKGNYLMSNEYVEARMQTIGRVVLLDRKLMTPEETIKKINAVDKTAIADIIARVLDTSTMSIIAVGPIDSIDGLFVL